MVDDRGRQVDADLLARTRELEDVNAELRELSGRHQRTAQALAGLAGTVSALAGAQSRSELVRQLFRYGRMALRADALALALAEPGGTRLTVVHSRAPSRTPAVTVPTNSSLPMALAAGGRAVYEADAAQDGGPPPLPGLRAWAALPLRAAGRPLGSLTVGWDQPHAFDEDDVRLLGTFAAQCAQAVARVTLLESERREARATRGLAETLQRSLLTAPPRTEDLDIAVRYRPAAEEAAVGGDWYDVFPGTAESLVLVVGDVTGHDSTAAALAGQLRSMVRGIEFALDHAAPADTLTALDRALRATGEPTLASAVVARVEPSAGTGGVRTVRWSNAGHPPPLRLEHDGTATLLDPRTDLLLGVDPATPRQNHVVELRPGSTLVLYTDGLVERRTASLDDGFARLQAAGRELAGRPVDQLCDELIDRLEPDLTDDIALLALRVPDRPVPASPS